MCDILWRLGIWRLRRCQGSFQERTGCLEKGLPCLPITPLPTQQKSLCRHTKCPTAKPKQVKQTKPKYCSYPFLYRYLLAAAPNQSSIKINFPFFLHTDYLFLESISHRGAGKKKKSLSIKTNRRKVETLKNYI